MSRLPEQITLGPTEEADRLWRGALDAHARSAEDLIALCESLDLGLRAAEILVVHKLQPVKANFPATIAAQLDTPDPKVEAYRDAINTPKALQFTEILDLLSDEGLECVGPRLHRGWEDRRFSCSRSRQTAFGALGVRVDGPSREQLLLLSAYRNRIFRYPPPICIETRPLMQAFEPLNQLVDRLLES